MNPEYLFYSIIGNHAGETVGQIIARKSEEISRAGYSLWSCQIDRKSIEQIDKLKEDDEVLVLCKVNRNAKDPVVKNGVIAATKMMYRNHTETIPEGIRTTYGENKASYQAYVVERYEILDNPINFNFAEYATTQASGVVASFKDRFKCSQFQNTFGFRIEDQNEPCEKEISVVMHLKYPFAVNIK